MLLITDLNLIAVPEQKVSPKQKKGSKLEEFLLIFVENQYKIELPPIAEGAIKPANLISYDLSRVEKSFSLAQLRKQKIRKAYTVSSNPTRSLSFAQQCDRKRWTSEHSSFPTSTEIIFFKFLVRNDEHIFQK